MVKVNGHLTIYGQSEGTGTLTTSNTIGGGGVVILIPKLAEFTVTAI